MKPRLFIGSSVEGLKVAYAIQQNLQYDVDTTVWDQGVFGLSDTTIESLSERLDDSDFGIFVLSGDDELKIRGQDHISIRDNVLFELGLFIGKLGRKRVFFLTTNNSDLHVPTDLVGITSGKYNAERDDNNMQAETAPFCHSVRMKTKELGLLRIRETEKKNNTDTSSGDEDEGSSKKSWEDFFINQDYDLAKDKLVKSIKNEKDDETKLKFKLWLSLINFKKNFKDGLAELYVHIGENPEYEEKILRFIVNSLSVELYHKKAIELANEVHDKFNSVATLILLANVYVSSGDSNTAIKKINESEHNGNVKVRVKLIDILKENDNEMFCEELHNTYVDNPNNEDVIYKYAEFLHSNGSLNQSLYLFDYLTSNFKKTVQQLGTLSNVCLELNLNDKAFTFCQEAIELEPKVQDASWLHFNVGNMYNNRGLYTEAINCIKNNLEFDSESKYALNRLSNAIDNQYKEHEEYKKLVKDGCVELRNK